MNIVVAPTLSARTRGGGGLGTDFECDGGLIPTVARALTTSNQRIDAETETLLPFSIEPYTLAIRGRGDGHDLEYRQDGTANAVLTPNGGRGGIGVGAIAAVADTLTSHWHQSNGASAGNNAGMINPVFHGHAVRRLMPIECERLQGFADSYTNVEFRGKPAADGPRYKALGNSMAVNVMRLIGDRIRMVENLTMEKAT